MSIATHPALQHLRAWHIATLVMGAPLMLMMLFAMGVGLYLFASPKLDIIGPIEAPEMPMGLVWGNQIAAIVFIITYIGCSFGSRWIAWRPWLPFVGLGVPVLMFVVADVLDPARKANDLDGVDIYLVSVLMLCLLGMWLAFRAGRATLVPACQC